MRSLARSGGASRPRAGRTPLCVRRHYDERRESERPCHHRQLELFVDDVVF